MLFKVQVNGIFIREIKVDPRWIAKRNLNQCSFK